MAAAEEFDLVVVGAGGAGMTAALTAALHGLRAVVVEKAPHFGGSTARSGGGVWIPGNQALARAGVEDDPQAARTYLDHIVATAARPDDVEDKEGDAARRTAFLRHGPDMFALVERETPLRFTWVPGYADYYPEAPGGRPGGRSVEPRPLPSSVLGPLRSELEPPYLSGRPGLAIMQADYRWLTLATRQFRGVRVAAKVGLRAWFARLRRRELLTMGQALAAGLRVGLVRHDVDVRLSTSLSELIVEDDRVCGVRLADGGSLYGRRGVLLASGGFERAAAMRQQHQAAPIGSDWTVGAEANTGDGILAGQGLDAAVRLLDDAWWGPSVPTPIGPYFLLAERSLPGCVLVNTAGERYVNEAAPYVDAVHAMYAEREAHVPSWLVFDQRYRDRYLFTTRGPRQPLPRSWYETGIAAKSSTLAGLSEKIGVPAETLAATVERFNGFAATGVDEDFGKGTSAYDRYYGDPGNKPNPCLAALVKPPFHAVQIVPGDLGTKGGLVADERARVLRADGSVIPGLYAAGNTSALVMGRTYAGPGATLGPAMTAGYLAALDAAGADIE